MRPGPVLLLLFSSFPLLCKGFERQQVFKDVRTSKSTKELDLHGFRNIASMFPECNLYILSSRVFLEGIEEIIQPHIYYTDNIQYFVDYHSIPDSGKPLFWTGPEYKWWKLGSRAFCKAELVILDYPLTVPEERIQDLVTLEPTLDSNYVYQVLITTQGSQVHLPKSLFRWDLPKPPGWNFVRRVAARAFGHFESKDVHKIYYFAYVVHNTDSRRRKRKQVAVTFHPLRHKLKRMEIICMACKENDIVKESWTESDALDRVNHIAEVAATSGTIAAQDWAFSWVMTFGIVQVLGLSLEVSLVYQEAQYVFLEEYFKHLDHRKLDSATKFRDVRRIFSRSKKMVLPEMLIVQDLMNKHYNASFKFLRDQPKKKTERDTLLSIFIDQASEQIMGPGLQPNYDSFISSYLGIGDGALIFFTCSNVTEKPQTGLLTQPFDRNTWIALMVSMATAALTLVYSLQEEQSKSRTVLSVSFMLFRLLLENFQDLGKKANKWSRAFSTVIATTALCAITLSDGYRGVVTSDLVMAPTYKGPELFSELFDEGNWSFIAYTPSRLTQDFVGPAHSKEQMNMVHIYYKFKMTYNVRKIVSIPSSYKQAIDSVAQNSNSSGSYSLPCSCNRTAFLALRSSFMGYSLPDSCKEKMTSTKFIVGRGSILPGIIGWSARRQRTGSVFESLKRFVQSGVNDFLNRLLRIARSSLVIRGDMLEEADTDQEEIPLGMETPIVKSIFSVWWNMITVSVVTLMAELLLHFIHDSFSFIYPARS